MRASATLIVSLAMALAAVALAVAAPQERDLATVDIERASGALSIANSRSGQALFNAAAMRPGEGVSGTVTIGNDGDVAGRFAVRTAGFTDSPGPNGGKLSERVELVLFDVTDMQQPVTIFAGNPADFGEVNLGTLAAGEERDYLFAATLPDRGAGDNLYQGAGLSVGFEWTAGTVGISTPTATPTPKPKPPKKPTKPKPKPTPTPTPVTPHDFADALGMPAATKCARRGKLKFKLKGPEGAKVVSATVAVNGKTKLRLKGAKVRKAVQLKRLRKTVKVTVTAKASNGRTYVGTRTYRVCKR
jgi:spore coat-associated protein N